MQYNFTKTFSSGVEAGGDDIARKAFMKEHYQLQQLDLDSYPETAYDTPEKAGLALHCMKKIMLSDVAYMYGGVLRNLSWDIESFITGKPDNIRTAFMQNIATVMAHIIETAEQAPLVNQAMTVLKDVEDHDLLKEFKLSINKKKYDAALAEYENPSEGSLFIDTPQPA